MVLFEQYASFSWKVTQNIENIHARVSKKYSLLPPPSPKNQISDNNGIYLTNGELRANIIRVAQNIARLGMRPDDIFGLVARNSEHVAPIVYASMAIGCPINTLDPSFGAAEITHMFGITKPKLVFCDVNKLHVVRDSLKELKLSPIIYTFGKKTEYSRLVEDLLIETKSIYEFV